MVRHQLKMNGAKESIDYDISLNGELFRFRRVLDLRCHTAP
jgi:hypothetical protein